MADITMCKGGKCELKNQCYRFTAISDDDYQVYFIVPPYLSQRDEQGNKVKNSESKDCKHFWANKDSNK